MNIAVFYLDHLKGLLCRFKASFNVFATPFQMGGKGFVHFS